MKRRERARLFVDTGVLLAALLPEEARHADAKAILAGAARWRSVHTSDYVVAEGLNFLRQKVKRRAVADAFIELAFGAEGRPPLFADVLRIHGTRFAAALDRCQQDFDRGLSFTDWTSLVLIEEEKLDAIATFDRGFRGLVDIIDGAE